MQTNSIENDLREKCAQPIHKKKKATIKTLRKQEKKYTAHEQPKNEQQQKKVHRNGHSVEK